MQIIQMHSTQMQCFKGYVLIKPIYPNTEVKSDSGVIMQLTANVIEKRPGTGTVVTGCSKHVNPGDFVVFPPTDGLDCRFDDGDFILLKTSSIIGKRESLEDNKGDSI